MEIFAAGPRVILVGQVRAMEGSGWRRIHSELLTPASPPLKYKLWSRLLLSCLQAERRR